MTHNKKKPEILWRGEFPPSIVTSILDNAGEGIWYIDRHNRIRAVNSKGAEIVGCSKDEMIGRSPVDYLTHADSREGDKAVDKSGVHSLHKILRRDGSAIHVISRTVPLPLEDGVYGGALIYLLNVTEVNRWDHLGKDKEALLQEARMERDMLYQIIDRFPDEVGFFDHEFRCIYANSTLAASIGGRRGDIRGKSIQEMPFAQSDPSGIVTVLDSVFMTGEPVCQEGVYITEHGELTRYLFVGPVITPEKDVVAVFVISRTQLLYESE